MTLFLLLLKVIAVLLAGFILWNWKEAGRAVAREKKRALGLRWFDSHVKWKQAKVYYAQHGVSSPRPEPGTLVKDRYVV